jgi:TIR domain
MMSSVTAPIEVFCSYAHKDESLLEELEVHLSILQRLGLISTWHDRKLVPGTDWEQAIDIHLETASLILLLISADFLASDYCYGKEMRRALERHQANEACVIPILLRPVAWRGAPFERLRALPTGARPITTWLNQDEAFADIVEGIGAMLRDIQRRATGAPLEVTSLSQIAYDDLLMPIKIGSYESSPAGQNELSDLTPVRSLGYLNEHFKRQWEHWILETSKGLQPILKQTIISTIFILGYLLVVWFAGFVFVDSKNAFLETMYKGIKIVSVIVISVHYLASCIIEMFKAKNAHHVDLSSIRKGERK